MSLHGTWASYNDDSCRCEVCRHGAAKYSAAKKRNGSKVPAISDHAGEGTWVPSGVRSVFDVEAKIRDAYDDLDPEVMV